MTKVQVYTSKGSKTKDFELPKDFSVKPDFDLITQSFRVFEDRSHKGTNVVKTRAQVNATTKKVYKQKGTGGARHGSKKAPIFVGGGVAHGPKGVKRTLTLPRKMSKLALKMVLGQKLNDKAICLVESIKSIKKTKEASSLLEVVCKEMGLQKAKKVLVVLKDGRSDTYKAFRNIKGIELAYWSKLGLRSTYLSTLLVVDNDVFDKVKKVEKK